MKTLSIPEPMQASVYGALGLSISHLSGSDKAILSSKEPKIANRALGRETGFIVKLLGCTEENDVSTEVDWFRSTGLSESFLQIVEFACRSDIGILEFDIDADQHQCFKVYE
ncbi:DUF5983 family protein [Vibrio mediterranei]|uniref:DUF5983 family protein n=1 Tax=Vibrio mediterranei TaxID=689 RepID=UPI0040695FC4